MSLSLRQKIWIIVVLNVLDAVTTIYALIYLSGFSELNVVFTTIFEINVINVIVYKTVLLTLIVFLIAKYELHEESWFSIVYFTLVVANNLFHICNYHLQLF